MTTYDFHPSPEGDANEEPRNGRLGLTLRIAVAAAILLLALIAECMVMVPADEAVVISPSRRSSPRADPGSGLSWKLPAPIETTIPIDLRLRTTSTGLQDVGTKDGLRILVQVYTAWQVPDDPQAIRQFPARPAQSAR